MPLFDYKCDKCDKTIEIFLSFSDLDNEFKCLECGCVMNRQFPNTFNFELTYNPKKDRVGWSYDGYSTTQRYREYDKQAKHNIFDQGRLKK